MPSESLLHRISINKTGKVLPSFKQAKIMEDHKIMIDAAQLAGALENHTAIALRDDLETIPRRTTLKMVNVPIDVNFTFRVAAGEAKNYIGAMRQVLSRTRKKAKRKTIRLDEFKMCEVSITHTDEYDEITLVRSKTLTRQEESVYEELFSVLKKG